MVPENVVSPEVQVTQRSGSRKSEIPHFGRWFVFLLVSMFMEVFDIYTDIEYYNSLTDNAVCGFKETVPQLSLNLLRLSIVFGTVLGFVIFFFQVFPLLVRKPKECTEEAKKLSWLGSKRAWIVRELRALGEFCWEHDRKRTGWKSCMVWLSLCIFGLEDVLHLSVMAYVANEVGVSPESKSAFLVTLITSTLSSLARCAAIGYTRFQKPKTAKMPPKSIGVQELQQTEKGQPSPKRSQTDTASISQVDTICVSPKNDSDEDGIVMTPVTAFDENADSQDSKNEAPEGTSEATDLSEAQPATDVSHEEEMATKQEDGSPTQELEEPSVCWKVRNIDFKRYLWFFALTIPVLAFAHLFIWVVGNGTDVQIVAPNVQMHAYLNSTNWSNGMEFNLVAKLTGGLKPRSLFLERSRVLDVNREALWIEQVSTIHVELDRFSDNQGSFKVAMNIFFNLKGQRYCPCEGVFFFNGTEANDGTWTIPSEQRTEILATADECRGYTHNGDLCDSFSATIPEFGVEYVGTPSAARALEEGCTQFKWTGPFCERNETHGSTVAEVIDCGGSIIRSEKQASGLMFYGSNDISPFLPSRIKGCFIGAAREDSVTIESDGIFQVSLHCDADTVTSGAGLLGAHDGTYTLADSGTRRIQFLAGSGTVAVKLDSGDVGTVALSAGNGIDCDTSRNKQEAMVGLATNNETIGVQWGNEPSSNPISQASNSPTPTVTASTSTTPSNTKTSSLTPTLTRTSTLSETSTTSSTLSQTATSSPTSTTSWTATSSATSSRTSTVSATISPTVSETPSYTPSGTTSATASPPLTCAQRSGSCDFCLESDGECVYCSATSTCLEVAEIDSGALGPNLCGFGNVALASTTELCADSCHSMSGSDCSPCLTLSNVTEECVWCKSSGLCTNSTRSDYCPIEDISIFEDECYSHPSTPISSCKDLQGTGAPSDTYWIDPTGGSVDDVLRVYCDNEVDQGGWTLVASTLGSTLNDQGSEYYADLASWSPSGHQEGIWNGMRSVIDDFADMRFTCRIDTVDTDMDVDMSFYSVRWYREITESTNDNDICFEESDGHGYTLPAPARRNNNNGDFRSIGTNWAAEGYLEAEDDCDDTGDFSLDFDDRGMDKIAADGTDWGEDDGFPLCGPGSPSQRTSWQVWVREANPPVSVSATPSPSPSFMCPAVTVCSNGDCNQEYSSRTFCDFDGNDECGFFPDLSFEYSNWFLHGGDTLSADTGPMADHTIGSSAGIYWYNEASVIDSESPLDRQSALISASFPLDPAACVSFWYHMYGNDIESLRVDWRRAEYKEESEGPWNPTDFIVYGNQGNRWLQGHIFNVSTSGEFIQLRFVVKQTGFEADVAIDDFSFCPTTCVGSTASPRPSVVPSASSTPLPCSQRSASCDTCISDGQCVFCGATQTCVSAKDISSGNVGEDECGIGNAGFASTSEMCSDGCHPMSGTDCASCLDPSIDIDDDCVWCEASNSCSNVTRDLICPVDGMSISVDECFSHPSSPISTCKDLQGTDAPSGSYWLNPGGGDDEDAVRVYCDNDVDGGGWTLVAATRGDTLNDQGSAYYSDLGSVAPASSHSGLWNGLRSVIDDYSDVRFTCRLQGGASAMTVDMSFYSVLWYREITASTSDSEVCFEERNGEGYTRPAPARRNNINGEFLGVGNNWNAHGYLEGEDSCSDTGDFTIDFDDRGMDRVAADGTDWGEDDNVPLCGGGATSAQTSWQVWVRKSGEQVSATVAPSPTPLPSATSLPCSQLSGSCGSCISGDGCVFCSATSTCYSEEDIPSGDVCGTNNAGLSSTEEMCSDGCHKLSGTDCASCLASNEVSDDCIWCDSGAMCTNVTRNPVCESDDTVIAADECYSHQSNPIPSCLGLRGTNAPSGTYWLNPSGNNEEDVVRVYCDNEVDGGGWTLVASTLQYTLNDQGSAYYSDLASWSPSTSHAGIWDGLRSVITSFSDVRFTCRTNTDTSYMTVDLSFYSVDWYRELTASRFDSGVCFEESNGNGHTRPAPARRNNLKGTYRGVGEDWDAGFLEGEDACSDTGDFTVDFTARGMDRTASDGSDWGEDDGLRLCGLSSTSSRTSWHIWARSALPPGSPSPTPSPSPSPSSTPVPCSQRNASCGSCIADGHCVYCSTTGACLDAGGVASNSCGSGNAALATTAEMCTDRCHQYSGTSCLSCLESGTDSVDCLWCESSGACSNSTRSMTCDTEHTYVTDDECYSHPSAPMTSCQSLQGTVAPSGTYWIDPNGGSASDAVLVYCDNRVDGGGWTLVASTRGETLNDQGSSYYSDLASYSPLQAHDGVWNGMRSVIQFNSDVRFTCRLSSSWSGMTVDMSFYNVGWYRDITASTSDVGTCFEEDDGWGYTLPAPARRNNLTGSFRAVGENWGFHGYLEGEDSCGDTGDFTIDLDDRGMDVFASDGTDWGEDDHVRLCGLFSTSAETSWHIWVRN